MKLSSIYSATTGLKVKKPFLWELYYPIVEDKFITIDTKDSFYFQWQQVLDMINPLLAEKGISVFHLGKEDDPTLQGANRTNGSVSPNQLPNILHKSLLHLSSNNFSAHVAASLGGKVICLLNKEKEKFNFDWGNSKNHHFLYPIKKDNFIKPENIAQKICDILKIDFSFEYETIFSGERCRDGVEFVESSPLSLVSLKEIHVPSVIIRMDFDFDEQGLVNQLNNGDAIIVTNKAINNEIISNFKSKIKEFIYIVEEDNDNPDFCAHIVSSGISLILISYLPQEKINEKKVHYMDMGNITKQTHHSIKSLPDWENLDLNNLYYKSKKYFLKDNKVHQSDAACREGIACAQKNQIQKVINTPLFWKNLDLLTIFKKKVDSSPKKDKN